MANLTIHTQEGRYYMIYSRPEAEPRAVQVQGYFYPVNSDDEVELREHTYYAEPSSASPALKQYLRFARKQVKEMG